MELLGSAAEYEAFIEDRLKVDLKMIEEQTEKLLRQLSDYVNLKNNLLAIERNHLKKLSTLIDIGGFYVKTKIPDTSHVFVNVGLGFHVEFTLQEALAFIELKETHLAGRINALGQKANGIKSHIRVMVALVDELQKQPAGV